MQQVAAGTPTGTTIRSGQVDPILNLHVELELSASAALIIKTTTLVDVCPSLWRPVENSNRIPLASES